jgi:glycosyltransferase involved in cell wall biosynthesis
MNAGKVDILLATYNGSRFLADQIDSLLGQSYLNFQIIIRDDGSQDSTSSILLDYAKAFPEKISVLQDTDGTLGVIKNFSRLLEHASSPYVMLCDQDDVWLPQKVESAVKQIKQAEQANSLNLPILAHTDLLVVDQTLNIKNRSFMNFAGLKPERSKFKNILVQNIITGCTVIMNRPLVTACIPIPEGVLMHDWWIALVASSLGKIHYSDVSHIYYRQHGENVLGVNSFNPAYIYKKFRGLIRLKGEGVLAKNIIQAKAVYAKFSTTMDTENLNTLQEFISLEEQSFWGKRQVLLRKGFSKGRFSQNVGLYLKI